MAFEVYEVSQIEIGSGQSVKFTDGFYKITGVQGALTADVGLAPAFALKLDGADVIADPNWFNLGAGTPITAGDLAGGIIIPTIWASQPVIQVGQTLSVAATDVEATLWVTVSKVGSRGA